MSTRYDVIYPRNYTRSDGQPGTDWIRVGVAFLGSGNQSITLYAMPSGVEPQPGNLVVIGLLGLVLLVPVALAAYLLAQRRRSRYTVRFTNLDLLANVDSAKPGWCRHVPPAFYLLALAALLTSLARPEAVTLVPKEQATVGALRALAVPLGDVLQFKQGHGPPPSPAANRARLPSAGSALRLRPRRPPSGLAG